MMEIILKFIYLCTYLFNAQNVFIGGWFPLLIQGTFSMLPPEGPSFCRLTEDRGTVNTQGYDLCKALGHGDFIACWDFTSVRKESGFLCFFSSCVEG